MFTGIVAAVGRVNRVAGARLWIESALLRDAPPGASVAVDGVCLTVASIDGDEAAFDVSPETAARTTLGAAAAGDDVNLERPMRAGDEFGGHIVQGHVDGVGVVVAATDDAAGRRLSVEVPEGLDRYVVEKGSVTLNGVSLTVTGIEGRVLGVALIPHTLQATTLGAAREGVRMNVEVDVLAKYVHRLVAPYAAVGPESDGSGYL